MKCYKHLFFQKKNRRKYIYQYHNSLNIDFIDTIDEGFLERMKRGDVFVLGGSKYEYAYVKGMNLYVKSAIHKNPTIPSWFSDSEYTTKRTKL